MKKAQKQEVVNNVYPQTSWGTFGIYFSNFKTWHRECSCAYSVCFLQQQLSICSPKSHIDIFSVQGRADSPTEKQCKWCLINEDQIGFGLKEHFTEVATQWLHIWFSAPCVFVGPLQVLRFASTAQRRGCQVGWRLYIVCRLECESEWLFVSLCTINWQLVQVTTPLSSWQKAPSPLQPFVQEKQWWRMNGLRAQWCKWKE